MLAYSVHTGIFRAWQQSQRNRRTKGKIMPWLYQRKGSNNWWLGYRINGKQVLESTGETDEAKAQKILDRMEAAAAAHRAGALTEDYIRTLTGRTEVEKDATLKATFAQWLTECKDLSPVTLKRYRNVTTEFCTYVKATDEAPKLGDVKKDIIARFLRQKRSETSAANAKLYRKILASFLIGALEMRRWQVLRCPPRRR